MVLSGYAIVFWIIGLLIGIFTANFIGMEVQKTGILFGGIGVMVGVILGYRTVNYVVYGKNKS
jgi:hypothetical protein